MVVGYRKPVAIFFLVMGGLLFVMNVVLLSGGASSLIRVIPAAICLLVGILYTVRPYFRYEPGAIVVPALIGPLRRVYPFRRPEDVVLRDGKVFIRVDGAEKKVGITRWLADRPAWDAVMARLQAYAAGETTADGP